MSYVALFPINNDLIFSDNNEMMMHQESNKESECEHVWKQK